MEFKKYPKIQALHKEECDGILFGTCYIQEKVDGANASIWLGDDNEIHYGSRSRDLFLDKDNFNGFGTWIENNKENLGAFFTEHPNLRLYGEWLVRHTIGYNELSYKKFYLFDIEDEQGKMYDIKYVQTIGEQYNIPNFVNKFGDPQHGKYVTQEFKEDNAVTFGGNNRSSETYEEMYYVNQFMTLARVTKIFHKLESSEGRLEMKHIPQIMGMCYHDLITEEAWVIAKEMGKSHKLFNFKAFQDLCNKKSKSIFIELLTGDISVANKKDE